MLGDTLAAWAGFRFAEWLREGKLVLVKVMPDGTKIYKHNKTGVVQAEGHILTPSELQAILDHSF